MPVKHQENPSPQVAPALGANVGPELQRPETAQNIVRTITYLKEFEDTAGA